MAAHTSFATQKPDDVLAALRTTLRGLSEHDAAARRAQYGPNALTASRLSAFMVFTRQFTSPFLYLLIAATGLSFALGEIFDGVMILGFVLLNAILGFLQEYRSEQTIHLLSKYLTHHAHVLRNSTPVATATELLVPGDVIALEPGDRIPADIRFVICEGLAVDESVLTGESVPIAKDPAALATEPAQAYAAGNMGFSGTTVVSGHGTGVVVATGKNTAVGAIAKLTAETERTSAFSIGISKISRFILQLIGITLALVFVANLVIHRGETNGIELLIFSIALAVSVTPEALPVVMTFSFARGARRLAANKVVVKRLSAVEDLGSVEVLCTDKTGTLTENALTVAETTGPMPQADLLRLALTAASSFEKKREANNAFDLACSAALPATDVRRIGKIQRLESYPFDPTTRTNAVRIHTPAGTQYILRGAPENVLARTNATATQRHEAHAWVDAQGLKGRRVLAVAYTNAAHGARLTYAGLISFVDPVKKTTRAAVEQAKRLGVRIVMLTGDSAAVAGAVGKEIGLTADPAIVMTGEQFAALSEAQKKMAVQEYAVFARTSPRDKYDIIETLKTEKVIGFLGEGINDAPALKTAHVALAVDHASDIARDTADIVLLKKNLHIIVDGIREGREIFANTTKYIRATLTSNFGNFYAVAVASLLIPFLPMLPVQLLLLNLLSDFPMITIAADTVDAEELKSPRQYDVKDIAFSASILGVVSSAFDFLVFALFVGLGASILQTNWFIASVITELLLLFSIRTRLPFWKAKRPAGIVLWLSLAAIGMTLLIPYTAPGQKLFQFVTPTAGNMLVILLIAVLYFATTESVKLLYFRMTTRKTAQ